MLQKYYRYLVFTVLVSMLTLSQAAIKQVLVVQNMAAAPIGILQDELVQRGYRITTVRPYRGDSLKQIDPLKPDLVVVLGGEMGAYEADQYPFLSDEVILLKARHDAAKPSLGICLGAQLLAEALGGQVHKGRHGEEFGLTPLQVNAQGKAMSLGHLSGLRVMESHGDVFELPPGISTLASTKTYPNQAFQDQGSLGLQFHPEVTPAIIKQWMALSGQPQCELSIVDQNYIDTQLKARVLAFWRQWLNTI